MDVHAWRPTDSEFLSRTALRTTNRTRSRNGLLGNEPTVIAKSNLSIGSAQGGSYSCGSLWFIASFLLSKDRDRVDRDLGKRPLNVD